jgi:hypothetical protein
MIHGLLPPLPDLFTREALQAVGFTGWMTWKCLRVTDLADVPSTPGVYIIYRVDDDCPRFLDRSPAGWLNREDPTVPVERLQAEWVPDAHVLNIGKAAQRKHGGKINALRARLGEYADYGAGEPTAHRGGRLIWQLVGSDELLVAWHEVTWAETARAYEKRLLARFAERNGGRRPFANLTG